MRIKVDYNHLLDEIADVLRCDNCKNHRTRSVERMKIKFQHATGRAVVSYKNDDGTIEEAIELLKNPDVISITVTKMTPAQYLKKAGALNGKDE